ncbi:MAG TPA: M20/M25/M40 family metallo-hydrolase [Vicinamibacterales bacterium]|nr:M20/M25/M40 family metallo-hydrolase [Vicinamibacterales bacterium]
MNTAGLGALVPALVFVLLTGSTQIDTPDARVKRVVADARFGAAMAAIDRDHDRLVSEIIALTEIPAPSFMEDKRGAAYLQMLRAHRLADVERDEIGNVMGLRRGTNAAGGPVVAILAHLDTVFPEGTDVTVKRNGTRLTAPGVGDNTRSLAVLLAMVRAMDEAGIRTASDILFVGNVGEEGLGDLRGVKHLLQKGKYKDRIKQVIAVDGAGVGSSIVNGGVGSKRYRVTFKGPGGHSYGAFGLVNPAFAMGAAMEKLSQVTVPASPKTTFNVGVVGGGTSVNSIPFETFMEVDMRSESPVELEKLETAFLMIVRQSVDEENKVRSTKEGKLAADVKLVGDRPSGQLPATTPLVQIAVAAARAEGLTPSLGFSSTDANVPISMGMQGIRLNSGGRGDRAHALEEWIDVEKADSLKGIRVLLATLVAAADLR